MTIVCHGRHFIFVKTRKTAGSSVEIALSRLCGQHDFITPLGRADSSDEQLRQEEGGHPPLNWQRRWWKFRSWKEFRHRIKHGKRPMVLGGHAPASRIRDHFGKEVWCGYTTITIERNPWDKAVSRYWWMRARSEARHGTGTFPSLSAFLERVARERPHWLSNWDHYAIGDRVIVDRVMFYESLQRDLYGLADELRVDRSTLTLPVRRAKGGFRKDERHYSEILSKTDRDIIASVCHREIEYFGYIYERQ